jgi:hypothetical protein
MWGRGKRRWIWIKGTIKKFFIDKYENHSLALITWQIAKNLDLLLGLLYRFPPRNLNCEGNCSQ